MFADLEKLHFLYFTLRQAQGTYKENVILILMTLGRRGLFINYLNTVYDLLNKSPRRGYTIILIVVLLLGS